MKKTELKKEVHGQNPLYNERPILHAAESAFSELYRNLEELKSKNDNPYSDTKCLVSSLSQMMSLAGLIKNGANENDVLKACNGIFQSIIFAIEAMQKLEQELDNSYSAQESISKTKSPNVLDILETLFKNLEEQLKTTEEIITNIRNNEENARNKIENYTQSLESLERDILIKQAQLEEAEKVIDQNPAKILKELSENKEELNIEQLEELLKTAQQKLLELQKQKRKKEDIEKEIKEIQENQKIIEDMLKKQTNILDNFQNERKNLEQEELFPLQRDVGAIKRMIENRNNIKERKIIANIESEINFFSDPVIMEENISIEGIQINEFDKLIITTLEIITENHFTASRRSPKTILLIIKNSNLLPVMEIKDDNEILNRIKEICEHYFSLGILNKLSRGHDTDFYGLTDLGKKYVLNWKNELNFDKNLIQNIIESMDKAEMTGKISSRRL